MCTGDTLQRRLAGQHLENKNFSKHSCGHFSFCLLTCVILCLPPLIQQSHVCHVLSVDYLLNSVGTKTSVEAFAALTVYTPPPPPPQLDLWSMTQRSELMCHLCAFVMLSRSSTTLPKPGGRLSCTAEFQEAPTLFESSTCTRTCITGRNASSS